MKKFLITGAAAFATAFALIATPAMAEEVYGPPASEAKPFVYPERFTQFADEIPEQAEARVTKARKCAATYALVGAVGGTALDIATTQWNQSSGYREGNKLVYGNHASVGEMLLFRGLSGAFSYWRITKASKNHPEKACRTAKLYAGISFLPGVANLAVRIKF